MFLPLLIFGTENEENVGKDSQRWQNFEIQIELEIIYNFEIIKNSAKLYFECWIV